MLFNYLAWQQIEQALERHRREIPVCRDCIALPKADTGYVISPHDQTSSAAQQLQIDPVIAQPADQLIAIEPAQRHYGDFDLEAARMFHEALDKHLARVAQADPIRRFVEGANQHKAPEAIDDARRLVILCEPILKG